MRLPNERLFTESEDEITRGEVERGGTSRLTVRFKQRLRGRIESDHVVARLGDRSDPAIERDVLVEPRHKHDSGDRPRRGRDRTVDEGDTTEPP